MSIAEVRAFLTSDGKLLAVGLLLSLIILAIDLLTPLGVAGGVPYVVLVLLCLWAKHSACIYLMAAIGTILTLVGLLLSPEGGVFWVVLTNRALAVLAIWGVALLSHKRLAEIDQRQLVETKRQSLEIRLGDVLSMTVDAVISADRQGRIKFFNPGAENIFGYESKEILGRPLEVLLPEAKREAHRAQRENFARGTASRRPMGIRSELIGMRKDGSEFPAIASISKITTGGRELYTAIIHDISERKIAQEQLQHAQKLESVGRLTGGIAHEFNNLLMVIHGNLEMIENQLRKHDPLKEFTSQAMAGAQRGARLTRGLLAFSRKQPLKSGNVELNGLILRIQRVLQQPLGASITLKTDLEEKLWPVSTDVGQIEATLLNFVVNARDAMPRGGTITVRTSNKTVDGGIHYLRDFLSPGDYCMLEVIDTGDGMTAGVKKQAFEPFFTTKESGKGTGLGLSSVYGFALQSGGHVEIDSEIGKGTTMRLYLPRSKEPKQHKPIEGDEFDRSRKTGGTILVLENDPDVRRLAATQLRSLGYDVIEAEDGPTALARLEESTDIDLLFADMVLPGGMSGPQTVHDARERYPDLKALFVSGYAGKNISDVVVDGGDFAVLRKPYMMFELAGAVAAVMNAD